ncbi:MAG: hypothetical protein AAFR87_19925 [Bacteroidota bacterium]
MKQTTLLFLCLCLCFTFLSAQTHSISPDPHLDQQFFLKTVQEAKNKNLRVPIDVQLHVIRKSDGSDGFTLNESNNLMRTINWAFANTLLIFQACGYPNYIDSDSLYNFEAGVDESTLIDSFNVPNIVNIYIAGSVVDSLGNHSCGYTYFPWEQKDLIVLNQACVPQHFFPHMMGHYFGLYDTDESRFGFEQVARTNCTTTGDLLCDTPADPGLDSSLIGLGCIYLGTATDSSGASYTPDTQNYMSGGQIDCKRSFSQEQMDRMLYYHLTQRNSYQCGNFGYPNLTFSNTGFGFSLNGMDIDAGATIINTGSNFTGGLSSLGFYLSTDSIIDQNDYLFGTTNVPNMGTIDRNYNSYYTGLCQNTYVPAGDYYLGLILDPNDRIDETNELDNIFLFPNGPHVTMNCAQTHPPNITLDLSQRNSYTVNGNEIEIYISLRNAGQGVTPGVALVNYYLSSDSLVDTLDYLIGSSIAGPMGLGIDFFGAIEVDVCTLGIEIPDSNYYIGFLLDPYDEIAETDETDNAWRFNNGPHASILCPVPVDYELTLSTNPQNAGNITGAGTYEENSQVEIVASPTSGFRFLNWSRDSVIVSTDSVFVVLIDDNIELIANFEMTTSILDLSEGERIKLYPNPNKGLLRLSPPPSGKIENLRIFNSLGQLIWK